MVLTSQNAPNGPSNKLPKVLPVDKQVRHLVVPGAVAGVPLADPESFPPEMVF